MSDLTAADLQWELAPAPDRPADDLLVDLILEAQAYRLLAQQAVHALHGQTGEVERVQRVLQHARDEFRSLRARVDRDAEVHP